MKELIDFSSLNEEFNLPQMEPVLVDWDECSHTLSEPTKGFPVLDETRKKMSEFAKKRFSTPEGREQLKQNGKVTMAKMAGRSDFQEKRLKGLRAKCEITWTVQKGEIVEQLTLKEFITKHGGNLGSLKQMLWRKGAYKGWTFTQPKD